MDWIDVRDRPLITWDKYKRWECTNDGNKPFVAAVPYLKKDDPGKTFWWIRLCIMEDETGLCIMGDDDNEAAGWRIDDVTHYFHLPENPAI